MLGARLMSLARAILSCSGLSVMPVSVHRRKLLLQETDKYRGV